MPITVHSWVAVEGKGDGRLPESWDTGQPPAVAATGVLTLAGNALNTETVTLDVKVYTFQTVLTDVDGNVKIGADADESIANLVAAITLGPGAGTKYAASMTLHPEMTAEEGAGDTMDVTAKSMGTAPNALATTETLTDGSFGGGTLSGGSQWGETDESYFNARNSDVAWSLGLDFGQSDILVGPMSVEDNYTQDLGGSGEPLRLNASKLTWKGSGTAFLVGRLGSPGTAVIVDTFIGRVVLGFAGDQFYIAPLMIKAGGVVVKGGAASNLYDVHLTGPTSRLEIDDSDVALHGHVYVRDGYAYIVPVTVANRIVEVRGGHLEQLGRVHSDGFISIVGGVMNYRPYDAASTTPDLYVDGGVLKLDESLVLLTEADFGTTVIGPRGAVIGGALSRDAIWPPSYDLTQEWP